MKFLVFNVKYSDNLGDGLLAMCLEMALANEGADTKVETIDIAGRTVFGSTDKRRAGTIKLLQMLPKFARRAMVSVILGRKLARLRRRYDEALKSADAVVIGGGNLFQDDDLNFPIKVGLVLECIAKSGKPLAIHAVGVSANWSKRARQLFACVEKTNIATISVRDELSRRNWEQHFPMGPKALIRQDPGLLANEIRLADNHTGAVAGVATIGICVTAPMILLRHANIPAAAIPIKSPEEYIRIILLAIEAGYRVQLFSNGAREDQAFAEKIGAHRDLATPIESGALAIAPRPERPEDLLQILKSTSVVVAHRLHACIAAYSLQIPFLGLDWDKKLSSFFQSIDRSAYCLSGAEITPNQVFLTMVKARFAGIDPTIHAITLAGARAGVASIYTSTYRRRTADVKTVTDTKIRENEPSSTSPVLREHSKKGFNDLSNIF